MSGWLSDPLVQPGFDLGRANLPKFLIRNLRDARIRELRCEAVQRAFLQILFGDDPAERVTVTIKYPYDSRPEVYAPSRDYDGRYGVHTFRKHFYSRIGDFDSKEKLERAVWLDIGENALRTSARTASLRVTARIFCNRKSHVSHSNWPRRQAVTKLCKS